MAESHSLRDLIIENAGGLFREKGYTATTIKQIAQASGCTTAALYYYFEDGKQHILREVIHRSAQEAEASRHLPQADSLEELVVKLGADLADRFPEVADRFNWIILQFGTLPDEEKWFADFIIGDEFFKAEAILEVEHTRPGDAVYSGQGR